MVPEVSGLPTSLGADTVAAGEGAGDDQLVQLGDLLSEAGAMLMGGSMAGGMMSGGACKFSKTLTEGRSNPAFFMVVLGYRARSVYI